MRLFVCFYCIAMVAGGVPVIAQEMTPANVVPTVEASALLPPDWPPPGRVGQVSLVSGNVDFRDSSGSAWADAELNQPIFAGEALRTGPRALGEIRIGANTIDLSNSSEIEIASLRDGLTQILMSRGRIGLRLRPAGETETVEVDVTQGDIWLLAPGTYDIDAAEGDRQLRVAVFDGTARFDGARGDRRIEKGKTAVLTGSESADAASIEPAAADEFVAWCRNHDYDETRLAAPYYVSRDMTGYDKLDSAGMWKNNAQYGPVWFPTQPEDWAPYRFGHWSWIAPWGWTWLDDQPWGFAPSHYGRWALIDDRWGWVPGNYIVRPLYAPAVVAFLGTPGVGLSSEEGATVAWFPLAPGEAYWPSYTRDLDYVRNLNFGSVKDVAAIGVRPDGEPPTEVFDEDFANRLFATVVPRLTFTNGRPIARARVPLPEKRLQDAPVLMGSPQIAPPLAQHVARAATPQPIIHAAVPLSGKGGAKPVHTATIPLRAQPQAAVLRGAHLRAPSYAGQPRGRQTVVLHLAHSRGIPGKKG